MALSGAMGMGFLGAGFGLGWAILGMALGALAGYLTERHIQATSEAEARDGE
jgi:hypothetical protein